MLHIKLVYTSQDLGLSTVYASKHKFKNISMRLEEFVLIVIRLPGRKCENITENMLEKFIRR